MNFFLGGTLYNYNIDYYMLHVMSNNIISYTSVNIMMRKVS